MNIQRVQYFCMMLLLVTSKNAYSIWPFTKTQPPPSLKQKVVNTVSRYPLATAVVAAPLVTSGVYAYNNKKKVKHWLNTNKTPVIAGLTALGAGLYVAQRQGYVSSNDIKSILSSAGKFVHNYRAALAAAEVSLAAYLSGIFVSNPPEDLKVNAQVPASVVANLIAFALAEPENRDESKLLSIVSRAVPINDPFQVVKFVNDCLRELEKLGTPEARNAKVSKMIREFEAAKAKDFETNNTIYTSEWITEYLEPFVEAQENMPLKLVQDKLTGLAKQFGLDYALDQLSEKFANAEFDPSKAQNFLQRNKIIANRRREVDTMLSQITGVKHMNLRAQVKNPVVL